MQSFKEFLKEDELKIMANDLIPEIKLGKIVNDYSSYKLIGHFKCTSNHYIRTLINCPREVTRDFLCFDSEHLTSLEGGPIIVGGRYDVTNCGLTSLEGAPVKANLFKCSNNEISSLAGIGKRYLKDCFQITCSRNRITSNILGLLLVKNLGGIVFTPQWNNSDELIQAFTIVENHLKDDKDVMEAREELIHAGLKDYAKF